MTKSNRCSYRRHTGEFCKRWANRDSSFCSVHQTEKRHRPYDRLPNVMDPDVHPLLRLASPRDAFDVVREAINATRTGQIRPNQAYALAALLNLWCKLYGQLRDFDRVQNLRTQMLGELTDADMADTAALEATAPFVSEQIRVQNPAADSTKEPAPVKAAPANGPKSNSNGHSDSERIPSPWGNRVDLGSIIKTLSNELNIKLPATEQVEKILSGKNGGAAG